MPIDPACSAEYLRKRFAERIWEGGPVAEFLGNLPDEVADDAVRDLVEGLIIECGAE